MIEGVKKIAFMICIAVIYPLLINKGYELINRRSSSMNKEYRVNYFYTTALAGGCAIILGSILNASFISAGLIFGGLFSVISGIIFSWNDLPDLLFFLLLLFFFIAVLLGSLRLFLRTKK